MSVYFSPNGTAKDVKKIYIGVDGVARRVKAAYIGVNGVAKLVYKYEPWSFGIYSDLQYSASGQTASIPGHDGVYCNPETGHLELVGSSTSHSLSSLYSSGAYVYTEVSNRRCAQYAIAKKVSAKVDGSTKYTYKVWKINTGTHTDSMQYAENDSISGYTSVTTNANHTGIWFSGSGSFNTDYWDKFGESGGTYYTVSSTAYYKYTVSYNPGTGYYTQEVEVHSASQRDVETTTQHSLGWSGSEYYATESITTTDPTYTVQTYKIYATEDEAAPKQNLLPQAINTDGSIFNGIGYKSGVRLSTSDGGERTQAGMYVSGFIPATRNNNIVFYNVGNATVNYSDSWIIGYRTLNAADMKGQIGIKNYTADSNGAVVIPLNDLSASGAITHFRISCSYLGSDTEIYLE